MIFVKKCDELFVMLKKGRFFFLECLFGRFWWLGEKCFLGSNR